MNVYPNRSGKGFLLFGGNENDAMNSAIVLELYHNAFLVHDDTEEESDEQREFPTLHAEYGVTIAITVGVSVNVMGIKPLMKI
jgi:geranylgeranyl diphosphate synthase type II